MTVERIIASYGKANELEGNSPDNQSIDRGFEFWQNESKSKQPKKANSYVSLQVIRIQKAHEYNMRE